MLPLRIVAIVSAYNEADIIEQTTCDLIEQGILVYLLDDGSTDRTVAAVEKYLGRGILAIERLRDTFKDTTSQGFQWKRILLRKAQLAQEIDAEWFIHHDADEFRESPWAGVSLNKAIERVALLGFNAIDFACFEFWPIHDDWHVGDDIRETFTHYAVPAAYDRVQIRCWKKTTERVDLASSGGHEARFPGRNVFPIRFILRHYPIRGQAHGERKVFIERRGRVLEQEHTFGWHVQYDKFQEGASFIRDPTSLRRYDAETARIALTLRNRTIEELEEALVAADSEAVALQEKVESQTATLLSYEHLLGRMRSELATQNSDSERIRLDAARREGELCQLRSFEESRTREIDKLTAEVQQLKNLGEHEARETARRKREIHQLRELSEQRTRQLDEVRNSKSWRATKPLRALYELSTRGKRPSSGRNQTASRATSRINWGDLARWSPISTVWGLDRGLPIDRHYIGRFLTDHRTDIRGRVIEVKDAHYARTIGADNVSAVDVLDIDATNPNATIIADLANADQIPSNQFDCFILTQTLHIVYDMRSALLHAVRLLKPSGVLLCTLPAVSRVNYEDGGLESGDYWRFTNAAVRRLFLEVLPPESIDVRTFGNVRTCAAFLYGLATEDLGADDLAHNDPWFPLVHCVRAVKPSGGNLSDSRAS